MRHAYVMDGPDGSAAKVTKYTVKKALKLANRNRAATETRIAMRDPRDYFAIERGIRARHGTGFT